MQLEPRGTLAYDGLHCSLQIARPAPRIVVVVLSGSDVGEFADFPMQELDKDLERFGSIELFIDARQVRGASIEVSKQWAIWMGANRLRLSRINMLTGSRYVQITAVFVRRFAGLIDRMRVFTDRAAFDASLATCLRQSQPELPLAEQNPTGPGWRAR